MRSHRPHFFSAAVLLQIAFAASALAAGGFVKGDPIRLTRGEMLLLKGENFMGAAKGQQFTLLQHDAIRKTVSVPFIKEDGAVLELTLPAEAVEPSPPEPWADLLRGVEAFRDQRFDEAKRLIASADQDAELKPLAAAILARVNAALTAAAQRTTFPAALQVLRDAAAQLAKLGHHSLALALDDGGDKLAIRVAGAAAAPTLPRTKLDRDDVMKRVATANRSLARARQAIGVLRLMEASKLIEQGLAAEPGRGELKKLATFVAGEIADAEKSYEGANKMRRFQKGAVHALSALERGLKTCADHPKLIELRKEMQGAFEERTSPPVTPAFLASAKVATAPKVLEEGHKLYTTRCAECHELELIDSRSIDGWQRMVSGMAGRAKLSSAEQARIMDYIAAAWNSVSNGSQ